MSTYQDGYPQAMLDAATEQGPPMTICTCPVEGEWQIHHPHCGDAGWNELAEATTTQHREETA